MIDKHDADGVLNFLDLKALWRRPTPIDATRKMIVQNTPLIAASLSYCSCRPRLATGTSRFYMLYTLFRKHSPSTQSDKLRLVAGVTGSIPVPPTIFTKCSRAAETAAFHTLGPRSL